MSFINVKMQSLADARSLSNVSAQLGLSLNRLSSGTRIIAPSSDPAGVGSIGKMEAQHKRSQAAATNVQNAASFVLSSAGFAARIGDMLSRMSELTQYSNDGVKTPADIALYQTEFKGLQDQLRKTIGGTSAEIGGTSVGKPLGSFNGLELYGPNPAGLSIASSSHAGDVINIPETNLRVGSMLQIIQQDAGGNYLFTATTPGATQTITNATDELSDQRSVLGGVASRLELAAGSLAVEGQNLTAAVSRIEDVDVAKESTRLSKFNILLESGTAMLSQANQTPKSVLKLLQA